MMQLHCVVYTFRRDEVLYLVCNEEGAFFASAENKNILWTCQNGIEVLVYLLDYIYIRFGSKLYRQNV